MIYFYFNAIHKLKASDNIKYQIDNRQVIWQSAAYILLVIANTIANVVYFAGCSAPVLFATILVAEVINWLGVVTFVRTLHHVAGIQ